MGGRTAWCHYVGGGGGVGSCPLGCPPLPGLSSLVVAPDFNYMASTHHPGTDLEDRMLWEPVLGTSRLMAGCLSLLACPTTAQGWTRGPHGSHHTSSLSVPLRRAEVHSLLPSYIHSPSPAHSFTHSLNPVGKQEALPQGCWPLSTVPPALCVPLHF